MKNFLKSLLLPVVAALVIPLTVWAAGSVTGRPVSDPLLINTIGSSAAGSGGVTILSDAGSSISLNPGGTQAFRCNPATTICSTQNSFTFQSDAGITSGPSQIRVLRDADGTLPACTGSNIGLLLTDTDIIVPLGQDSLCLCIFDGVGNSWVTVFAGAADCA